MRALFWRKLVNRGIILPPRRTLQISVDALATTTQAPTARAPKLVDGATRFSTNGHIERVENIFFIVPDSSKLKQLVAQNEWAILYGHRGSGKTTAVVDFIRQELGDNMKGAYVSLQGLETLPVERFWGHIMKRCHQELSLPIYGDRLATSADFLELCNEFKHPFVLVLDELDALSRNPKLRTNFFDVLRNLKETKSTHQLKAVFGVGPINTIRDSVTGDEESLSPFNVSVSFEMPYFTQEQTTELFVQYEQSRQIPVDRSVVKSVFSISAGLRGFVGFCGKAIAADVRRCEPAGWDLFVQKNLITDLVTQWATALHLQKSLQNPLYLDISREFLQNESGWQKTIATSAEAVPYLQLVAFGVLKASDDLKSFWIPSPIVRTIVMQAHSRRPLIIKRVAGGKTLEAENLIKSCLSNFSPSVMKKAAVVGKLSEGENRTQTFPKEAAYHFELYIQLQDALPSLWDVLPEIAPRKSDKQECDLVIRPDKNVLGAKGYAIELCAHVRERDKPAKATSLYGHFSRVQNTYALMDDIGESWVLNFTSSMNSPLWLPGQDRPKNIRVAHIKHDYDWKNVEWKVDGGEWELILKDGSPKVDLATKNNKKSVSNPGKNHYRK